MASQVLSGSSNPSYTNNTGQNVRIVINYMESSFINSSTSIGTLIVKQEAIILNFAGLSVAARIIPNTSSDRSSKFARGKSIQPEIATNSNGTIGRIDNNIAFIPLEIFLAPGQTFSAICDIYNIVVITED